MPALAIFPDTNIPLHYQRYDQVDWCAVAQADDVLILIPPVLIRELNKHKDNPAQSRTIRRRAASTLSYLDTLFQNTSEETLRPGVRIATIPFEPGIDFPSHQLSQQIEDDHLLASAIEYCIENPGAEVAIVTNDIGLRLKAGPHNLRCLRLPDELKLLDEPDPIEKELRDLRLENERLKAAAPSLTVEFEDGRPHLSVLVPQPRSLPDEYIDAAMTECRSEHAKYAYPSDINAGTYSFLGLTKERIDSYNRQLEEYYQHTRHYLDAEVDWLNVRERSIAFKTRIMNRGTVPATDVQILLTFPAPLTIYTQETFPEEPVAPEPPTPPENLYAALSPGHNLPDVVPWLTGMPKPPRNVGLPEIEGDSRTVRIPIQRVQHGVPLEVGTVYALFPVGPKIKPFQISYRIQAGNLPKAAEGKLLVRAQSG